MRLLTFSNNHDRRMLKMLFQTGKNHKLIPIIHKQKTQPYAHNQKILGHIHIIHAANRHLRPDS